MTKLSPIETAFFLSSLADVCKKNKIKWSDLPKYVALLNESEEEEEKEESTVFILWVVPSAWKGVQKKIEAIATIRRYFSEVARPGYTRDFLEGRVYIRLDCGSLDDNLIVEQFAKLNADLYDCGFDLYWNGSADGKGPQAAREVQLSSWDVIINTKE